MEDALEVQGMPMLLVLMGTWDGGVLGFGRQLPPLPLTAGQRPPGTGGIG